MSYFFFLVLAGLAWMALNGSLGVASFAFGVGIGALTWRIEGARSHRPFSPWRALQLLALGARLVVVFLWELGVANLQQLRIVFAPRIQISPCWISFETRLQTPAMRALLGMMIIMTPGSVTSTEIEGENGVWRIGIHCLDAPDPDAVVTRIRSRLEAPLQRMEGL